MRENWKYKPLGEICDFISGFTPSKQELNEKAGIPYFKVSDMNRDTNSVYMIETELFVVHPRKTIPANSIIFPKNGGAIFTGKKRILKYDSIIDLNTEALNIKDKNVNLQFLYTFLLGVDFGQFDNGGGLPSINIKKMKDFIVPVPPLPEQERIVSYLDAEFAKIDALKANIEQQLQASKDLFQSALKELLTPQKGWDEKKLGEIVNIKRGLTYSKNDEVETSEKIVLRSNNVNLDNHQFDFTELKYLKPSFDIPADKYLQKGDLLMCMSNGSKAHLGKVALYEGDSNRYAFGGFMAALSHKDSVIGRYLFYAMITPMYKEYIKTLSDGANINNLKVRDIESYSISFPSLQEQREIVAILDSLSEKVKALQENYNKALVLCNDLKQSLLKSIFE